MAAVRRTAGPGQARLATLLQGLGNAKATVGWQASAKYPDGTPVAYVAAIQEYGYAAGNIPPRPFLRPTVAEQQQAWRASLVQAGPRLIDGSLTVEGVLELLSMQAAGQIRQAISQVTSPPLKPGTIAARARQSASGGASQKPLVDTGIMLATLTSVVEPDR